MANEAGSWSRIGRGRLPGLPAHEDGVVTLRELAPARGGDPSERHVGCAETRNLGVHVLGAADHPAGPDVVPASAPRAHETPGPVDRAAPEIGPEVATPARHRAEIAADISESDCMAPAPITVPGVSPETDPTGVSRAIPFLPRNRLASALTPAFARQDSDLR